MKQALIYSLKVWLTAAVLSPLLLAILLPIVRPYLFPWSEMWSGFGFIIMEALIYPILALPFAAVFALITYLLNRITHGPAFKFCLIILALILTLPLLLLPNTRVSDSNSSDYFTPLFITYSIFVVAGTLYYKSKINNLSLV